ncbi:MAG TPA: M20/M25/M40 family metallo-hydrolase [Chloroflexia bacterium]|nr:M20/M25/M40 family metallo-hydrolase [Chloroflexia bacterium]
MPSSNTAIDAFLDAHLDSYIAETARLCAQPSVSAQGVGMQACADLVGTLLAAHGLTVTQFPTPGNPIVVGRAAGRSARTLLFYNHYDVQPAEPLELWTTPPFAPEVRQGALYARGAKDDKGELVARLAALDAVRAAHGGGLPCGVVFVVEGEEEIGSPHIAQFVQEHRDQLSCQGAIWEEGGIDSEGRAVISIGKRGILYVELAVETLRRDAHSGAASVLPNAAWRLLGALTSLRDPAGRIRIPGFYESARPPSARDRELLAALPSDEAEMRADFGVDTFVNGVTGEAFKAAVFEPTCNIAGLGAGYQGAGMKTVIPARATAKVDFRLVPDQDPDVIFAQLRRHLDAEGFADVTVTRLGAMWPAMSPADDPLVALTARTGTEVYGRPALLTPLTGGSSPVYAFAGPLGIPVVTAGVGYPDSRTHAPDEHVRLPDFVQAARHIARILDGFATL